MSAAVAFCIRPLDVFFFGGPYSQPAGEVHHAASVFPPSPRTFQGIVRSRLLGAADPPLNLADRSTAAQDQRAALVGDAERFLDGWQLTGPLPVRLQAGENGIKVAEPWFAAPRFLLDARVGPPRPAQPIVTSHDALDDRASPGSDPPPLYGLPGYGDYKPLRGWISARSLLWALGGKGAWEGSHSWPPFVRVEPRPGVAVGPDGAARQGLLYFQQVLRFRNDGALAGWLTTSLVPPLSLAALTQGTGVAGGGAGLALFEPLESVDSCWQTIKDGEHLPDEIEDESRWWLVSLTSAFLQDPTKPLADERSGGVQVEIVATLSGPPVVIGGYAVETGRNRPNLYCVPAGSAWLLRLTGGTPAQRAQRLHALNHAHPLGDREQARFGFGFTVVGHAKRSYL